MRLRVAHRAVLCALAAMVAGTLSVGGQPAAAAPLTPSVVASPNIGCAPLPGARRLARELLDDRYTLSPHPTVQLRHRLSWSEDPLGDRNWRFQFQSLWYVLALTTRWGQTQDAAFLERAAALVRRWTQHNSLAAPASDLTWYEHTTALRAIVLGCLATLLPGRAWLEDAVTVHGTLLADPAFGAQRGNHAIDQAIGLLGLGCLRDDAAWMALATDRLNGLVMESVDDQGVANEQAVGYDLYVWQRLTVARDALRACGRVVGPTFARVDTMPEYLAFATQPDGRYLMLGDTYDAAAFAIPGTLAAFAATGGRQGPMPHATIRVFDAGDVLGRTGWGEETRFRDEIAFSLGFGGPPELHGHHDTGALTLYGFGSRLLLDPGYGSYQRDRWRAFFRSRVAHNVVAIDRLENEPGPISRLVRRRIGSDLADFEVVIDHRRGVEDRRRVLFARELGYLVVEDRLSSPQRQTFRQLWHLAPGSRPRIHGARTLTRAPRGNLLIAQLSGKPEVHIVSARMQPLQGWVSLTFGSHVRAPVVEAVRSGRQVRFLTLLVPGETALTGARISGVSVTRSSFAFTIEVAGRRQRIVATRNEATLQDLPPAP